MSGGGDAGSARAHALEVLDWSSVTEALAARCATAAGARTARALRPDLKPLAIERSLDECEQARALLVEEAIPVAGVRDVASAVEAAERGEVLEPEPLADVARSLEAMGRLRSFLARQAEEAPALASLAESLASAPALVTAIDRAVDPRGALRDDASPELVRLQRRRSSVSASIEHRLDSLRRDPNVGSALSDDFFTVRDDRYVLPVRSDRRGQVGGILHGRSGSGQSLFVEPSAIVDLNNDLRAVGIEIDEEIQRILRELSAAVAREAAALRRSLDAHRALDLAVARARLAKDLKAVRPEITADGAFDLPALGHPQLLLRAKEEGEVVRNDLVLEPPVLGLVISGPNTGGKTVLLKALGLACLMLKAGLPVASGPGARLPLLRDVFADIGDEQSIALSLSTFSGHVANLMDVLAGCDEAGPGGALVLMDELMAGTDPAEGAALARALLERLVARRIACVVTTHYGELKTLAADDERYLNAGMEFDHETLRPSYRMRAGVPGASAALSVAERLGFPGALVERARSLVGTERVDAERLIRDLEEARLEADALRAQAAAEKAEAERLRDSAEARLDKLRDRDERFVREERRAFEQKVRELREEAARLTRELQQAPSLKGAEEAIRRLDELREQGRRTASSAIGPAPGGEDEPLPLDSLAPGLRVRSVSLGKEGRVTEEPDHRGRVRVAFGAFSVQLPSADLRPAKAGGGSAPGSARKRRPPEPEPAPRAPEGHEGTEAVPFTPQSDRNTLDLRGRRVEEALAELPGFLDRAGAAGVPCVVIIHGHGTGALRRALREALPQEPRIQAFRPGSRGEGGDGATVARLR